MGGASEPSYPRLVADSFDGPVLRYSRRLALLDEADERGIARIEARQLIAAAQKRAQAAHPKTDRRPHPAVNKVLRAASFAGGYALLAAAWCWVLR
jgi:hypothetical protein